MEVTHSDLARTALATIFLVVVVCGISGQLGVVLQVSSSLEVSYVDPEGDSFGPGSYNYSVTYSRVYRPEYFDLRRFSVRLEGETLKLFLSFTKVDNPLRSPLGFSPQVAHVYVAGKCENRRTDTHGLNVRLRAIDAWCISVVVAPNLGDYMSRVVFSDGKFQVIDSIYVSDNTIVVEIPASLIAREIDSDPATWRYLVAVSAYDPSAQDRLIRIGAEGSDAPVIYFGADQSILELIPKVLDILAETPEDQYFMLGTYSVIHGDIATVAAYPYAENTLLPSKPLIETMTIATTSIITETYVKAYYLPGVTNTVTSYVQVPKYGVELYSLAATSVILIVILAVILRKKGFPGK